MNKLLLTHQANSRLFLVLQPLLVILVLGLGVVALLAVQSPQVQADEVTIYCNDGTRMPDSARVSADEYCSDRGGVDEGSSTRIIRGGGTTSCSAASGFLTLPNWYRGLQCEDGGSGSVVFQGFNDLWIVIANVIDILLQVAGLLAVLMLIWGGIRYITSQGDPTGIESAKKIIMYAIIGLVFAIFASTLVGFLAGQF